MTLAVGSLCSGIGGLELGIERALGARTVWQSEIDPHAGVVLASRWPGVPNLGDLTTIDWNWVQPMDLMCFGFPCQDISTAGRRAGLEGDRSALWFACAVAVRVVRPRYLLVENVSALLTAGFGRVLADLAAMGYVGRWGCLRSSDVGAPHRRERIFVAAAHAGGERAGRNPRAIPRAATRDGRSGPDLRPASHGGATAPDADRERCQQPLHLGAITRGANAGPSDATPSDPDGPSRSPRDAERRDGAAPHVRGGTPRPGRRGGPASDTESNTGWLGHRDAGPAPDTDSGRRGSIPADDDASWGDYGPAIRRWETIHGPAPRPRDDRGRLNPQLPEWMMGFPPGWVTGLGLPRTAQLRLVGNAVQPQVAELAARLLLAPLIEREAAA